MIVFDGMIADMESNLNLTVSLVFIAQSYFKLPKTIRLNYTYYFIMKRPYKRELQQVASNHSTDF